jgi:hypothetical protein
MMQTRQAAYDPKKRRINIDHFFHPCSQGLVRSRSLPFCEP